MDILSIVLGVGTFLGGGGSAFMYAETRTRRSKEKRMGEVEIQLASALTPIKTDLSAIHTKMDSEHAHTTIMVKAALSEALEPIKNQISTLNTKVEPLWKSLEAAAIAAAQVLHQPDPARHEVDRLLESFIEGTLSEVDELELRGYLVTIKKWEPGQDVGFPVHPGEPTAAAILLSTMELARIRRVQERKVS